ncbi:Helicase, Snf2 family [Desulfonema limicola]|uniref:Helicase, Snf2 family n=1 Tax=Desulfonema limicola TaxID=45656 RepID=A0A975B8K5_9BACT|nr:DEAD/DEAH box helicase [Desulfonema limicola]QTA80585.1 Helicase, Snf2 family [Desulfonema limicola]
MIEVKSEFFEKLKRKNILIRQTAPVKTVFFQLKFDDNGAYIDVIDEKQKKVETSYEIYTGSIREVLKSIENIKHRNSFRIDWETPSSRVYLFENDYLIWQLLKCNNFVDSKFNTLGCAEGYAQIILDINEQKEMLETQILLKYQGESFKDILFLNESHVLAKEMIYQIKPVSENFQNINLFETRLFPIHLEKYLSLFFSGFENISVRYKDYKVIFGTPKQTQATLIFEKIDANNALYLKLSTSLPGFGEAFFDNYDVTKIAVVNEMDKQIKVRELIHEEIYMCFNEISGLLKKHSKALKTNAYYTCDNLFIIQEELAKTFIHKDLPNLIAKYAVMGAEKLKSYKIKAVSPRLNLDLSHGIDFLEGDASLEIEGESIALFDALNQYKKNSYISLNDGTHAIINKAYINQLNRIFKKQEKKVKISFFDLPIVEELIDKNIAEKAFKQSRDIFLGFNDIKKSRTQIPKVNAELRRYQKQGFRWLNYLLKNSLGGCLADDMGLGKTLQAITLLASIYPDQKKPSLVVMPKSLLFNWENEINKFKPELSYYIYHGMDRDLNEAMINNVILTTYAMMRNDIEQLKDEDFYYIILDESQNIKNMQSQTSRAVLMLQSEHRLALSGTPVENNLGELYSLFRFLNPSMFGSADDFNKYYALPIQKEDDKDALQELKKKIYPFILRRLKRDVLKDLPDKIEQTLYVEMSEEQKLFYEVRRRFYYDTVRSQIQQNGIKKSQFFILQALSELRQIASVPEAKTENHIISAKREILMNNISDVIANNHKVLVFANFLMALECIAEDLEKSGIEYLHMTGATRDRKTLVDKFQNDETYKVFLMTLKTGGIGLNLTAADYIFIFDPWWNKAAENQAVDRTHRIGQDKTVFSYKLITRGTIEEKILELQKKKSDLFENLISSDGASIKSLDEQDVEFILGD